MLIYLYSFKSQHNQYHPIIFNFNNETDRSVTDSLEKRKHSINIVPEPIEVPAMVFVYQATGICYAATEPFYGRYSSRGKFCGTLNTSPTAK